MREILGHVVSYTLSAAFCITAGALGGVLYGRLQDRPPRVVVVDLRRLIEPIAIDPALSEDDRRQRTEKIGEAVRASVETYVASGAIVLDASAVLRAPETAYVQP